MVEGARERLRQVVRRRTGASAVGKEGKGEEERAGEYVAEDVAESVVKVRKESEVAMVFERKVEKKIMSVELAAPPTVENVLVRKRNIIK